MDGFLKGKTLRLRALEPEDIDQLYAWENDSALWHVGNSVAPFSRYLLALYIKNSNNDIYESKQLRLVIETNRGDAIGAVDLFDFDPNHLRVGMGVLVYNQTDRAKGYATEALELLIDYCFNLLHLHQVYANVGAGNVQSIGLFTKLQFEVAGRKKDWRRTVDGWDDELLMQRVNPG